MDDTPPIPQLAAANPTVEFLEPEPHERATPGFGRPAAVFAVVLCGIFAFINLYSTQPLLPLFARLFREPKWIVGLTVSASTLGVAVSAPLLGLLAERISRKKVIVLSTLALAVPTLLAATSPGLHTLIVWRFLQGFILPGIFATTITYVGEEWPTQSVALVMSVYVSGTALGGFCGRLISGLAAERLGWRWAFLLLGLLTLCGAGAIARWLPPGTPSLLPQHSVSHRRQIARHFRDRRLLSTFGVGFGMLFALVGTFTYITFYLADPPFLLSTSGLSYLFTIYLVGLLVTPAGGYLVGRFGWRLGIGGAVTLCLIGELLTLSHSLWIVIFGGLGLVCTGVFIAQSTAASYLRVAAPPGTRVSAAGLYICCYYLGGTAGGLLPSYLWSLGRWPACVAFIAVLLAITLAVALTGWREPVLT